MKKVLALALCVCMAAMLLAGCGGAGSSSAAASASGSAAAGTSASAAGALDPNIKATLTFATYDNEAMDLYEEMDLEGRFQELYPNVNIEIEEFKDDAEYFNQMKIRASAGELPDLMYLQTRYYPVFKDYMVDLSHTQAAANNTLAAEFAVDGKIIGVPEKISTDYVFYWADMFEEAGVEVPKTWEDFVAASEKLQSYFVQRMEKYLSEKHGKKIIGWDEILEGGLAPSATVMSWRGEEGGIAAANMGHEAIMTPGSGGMYIDQFQGDPKIEPVSIGGYDPLSKVYAYNPIPDTLVATGKANLIKGVQTNLWSEYMYNTDLLEYRAYPRVLALAEIGWTPLARKDYKDFERRLDNALVRLDELNINYHIPQPEQPNGSCDFVAFTDKASLEFKTTRPVKVVYTIDGTEPTPESTAYSAPIEFTESGVLKIRSVLPSGKMSKTRTITVEKQALAPAKEVAKTTPGLEMQVTDGMFLNSSKLGDVKEWKKSVIKDLREITSVVKSSESMRGVKQYAAIATGYVNIPEDGVYYISSDNEEVWIDGKLLVNNAGEVKRFSRHDSSAALSKGLHEIKVVFLGHIIGGWPSNWNDGSVKLRKADSDKFVKITPEMLVH